MITTVLRAIGGVGIYDSISICLFVAVFCGVLFWAFRLKKAFLEDMSALPLDEPSANRETRHE